MSKEWLYVVTAVGIFEHRWKGFYRAIVRRKRELLARIRSVHGVALDLDSAEMKSSWVRIPREREKHPFLSHLTEPDITALVQLYFEQLAELPTIVISVIIDKRHLTQPTSQEWMHTKAWECLCERIEMFMWRDHPRHRAVLVADDMGKQQRLKTQIRKRS